MLRQIASPSRKHLSPRLSSPKSPERPRYEQADVHAIHSPKPSRVEPGVVRYDDAQRYAYNWVTEKGVKGWDLIDPLVAIVTPFLREADNKDWDIVMFLKAAPLIEARKNTSAKRPRPSYTSAFPPLDDLPSPMHLSRSPSPFLEDEEEADGQHKRFKGSFEEMSDTAEETSVEEQVHLPHSSSAPGNDMTGSMVPVAGGSNGEVKKPGLASIDAEAGKAFTARKGPGGRFYCPAEGCDKTYTQRHNLYTHYDAYHGKKTVHTCDECKKVYTDIGELRKHQKKHQSPEERKGVWYTCEVHNFGTAKKNDYDRHMESSKHVTKPKVPQVNCEDCHRGFKDDQSLERHKLTGACYEVLCSNCNRSFGWAGPGKTARWRHLEKNPECKAASIAMSDE